MKIVAGLLLVLTLWFQYRLWIAPDGLREVRRIKTEITEQSAQNEALAERNRTLAAEVQDLKKGRTAVEERARTDLGMIGANETFYQVGPESLQRTEAAESPPTESEARVRAASR
jgi:cell division protein FtsB